MAQDERVTERLKESREQIDRLRAALRDALARLAVFTRMAAAHDWKSQPTGGEGSSDYVTVCQSCFAEDDGENTAGPCPERTVAALQSELALLREQVRLFWLTVVCNTSREEYHEYRERWAGAGEAARALLPATQARVTHPTMPEAWRCSDCDGTNPGCVQCADGKARGYVVRGAGPSDETPRE